MEKNGITKAGWYLLGIITIMVLGWLIQRDYVRNTTHKEIIPLEKYTKECAELTFEQRGYYCEKGGVSY